MWRGLTEAEIEAEVRERFKQYENAYNKGLTSVVDGVMKEHLQGEIDDIDVVKNIIRKVADGLEISEREVDLQFSFSLEHATTYAERE